MGLELLGRKAISSILSRRVLWERRARAILVKASTSLIHLLLTSHANARAVTLGVSLRKNRCVAKSEFGFVVEVFCMLIQSDLWLEACRKRNALLPYVWRDLQTHLA